jgi:hypothetical protein
MRKLLYDVNINGDWKGVTSYDCPSKWCDICRIRYKCWSCRGDVNTGFVISVWDSRAEKPRKSSSKIGKLHLLLFGEIKF